MVGAVEVEGMTLSVSSDWEGALEVEDDSARASCPDKDGALEVDDDLLIVLSSRGRCS